MKTFIDNWDWNTREYAFVCIGVFFFFISVKERTYTTDIEDRD